MSSSFWDRVETVAKGLGATEEAIRQWKHRKVVPAAWHLPLYQNAQKYRTEFSLNEFTKNKAPRKRRTEKASIEAPQ